MSDSKQTAPIMDGSDDATDEEKRAGLAEQADHDRAGQGAGARADEFRKRLNDTDIDP